MRDACLSIRPVERRADYEFPIAQTEMPPCHQSLTTKWIKRSAHRSVRELVASIRTWITNWNDNPKPFVLHKSADEILDTLAAYCQRINDSGH